MTITTLYVCSVHRGMFSTSGGYHEHIGGIPWAHRGDTMSTSGVFSTSGGYHDACGGYHEYIGGCSVHRRDTVSTLGGYHEYIGVFNRNWKVFTNLLPHMHHDISRCTHDIPLMYSWYPPMNSWYPLMYWTPPYVLMISPLCTHDILPIYSWYPPDVLNIPRCTEHAIYRVITDHWFLDLKLCKVIFNGLMMQLKTIEKVLNIFWFVI